MSRLSIISVLVLLSVGLASGSIINSSSVEGPVNSNSSEVLITADEGDTQINFSMVNTTSYEIETGVVESSYGNNSLNIAGHIEVATPCRNLEHNLTRTGDNSYTLDITTLESMGSCVQVQAYTRYNADIEGERPLDLEVTHNGETVATLEDPIAEEKTKDKEETSVLDNIVSYLRQLFR